MNRRNFIKLGALGTVPLFVGWNTAFTNSLATNLTCEELHDRVMVVVMLQGGLDSINYLIPEKYRTFYDQARPNIGVKNPLMLDTERGLHPELAGLKAMYDNGEVAFVDAVGYDNTSGSHFASTDIVMAGGDITNIPRGGLTGRMMESIYPQYPTGYPNGDNRHPIALQFGSMSLANLMLNSKSTPMGLTQFDDVSDFHGLVSSVGGSLADITASGKYKAGLDHVIATELASNAYANNLLAAWNKGSNSVTYTEQYPNQVLRYNTSPFAGSFKAIARLIDGGCDTRLYVIQINGNAFDTHSQQVGQFDALLFHLSNGIAEFTQDLKASGNYDRVLGMTMSEFGRQVFENSGGGTDHGTYWASTLFGAGLKGGLYGDPINLLAFQNNRVTQKNFDYREIVNVVARDWLGFDKDRMDFSGLSDYDNTTLDFIAGSSKAPQGCYTNNPPPPDPEPPVFIQAPDYDVQLHNPDTSPPNPPLPEDFDVVVYPNPTSGTLNISVTGDNLKTVVAIITNITGKVVFRDQLTGVDDYSFEVYTQKMAKGLYFYEVRAIIGTDTFSRSGKLTFN